MAQSQRITQKIVRGAFNCLNRILYFMPIYQSNYRFRHSLLIPLYNKKQAERERNDFSDEGKTVVYMVLPETTFSGGLSDRLRGIVAIYKECKRKGLPFRIVFEPLHLEDYLQPNEYDWRITSNEICWDTKKV